MMAFMDGLRAAYVKVDVRFVWGVRQRQEFYQLLADFVSDGVPVHEAVQEIHDRYVKVKDARRHITQSILDDQRGSSGKVLRLGQTMGKWSPSLEALAIDAGEQGISVAGGLRMAAGLASVRSKIKATLWGELSYPAVLLVMLAGFMLAVDRVLLPVFEELVPRSKWPPAPTYLGYVADASMPVISVAGALLTLVLVSFALTKGRWVGRVRDFLDAHIAPWSIHRRVTGSIFISCFAALTTSGMPFSQSITRLSEIATPWELDHLDRMRSNLRRGMFEGDAMATELFDDEPRWKISAYGRRTNFAEAIESISKQISDLTVQKIRVAAVTARVVVYFLITGMLAWVYGSFLDLSFAAGSSPSIM